MFQFHVKKAIQAAGVLVRFERGNRIDKLRLLKLLYVADRQAIRETGHPIIGSRVVAMDHGPLHSDVLDLINGTHSEDAKWSEHFRLDGYHVEMESDPGRDELSVYEIEKLNQVSFDMIHYSSPEVAELTHAFDEWRKHWHDGTSTDIQLEDILEAVGCPEAAQRIRDNISEKEEIERLFGK